MSLATDVLGDAFDRIEQVVATTLDGLDPTQLAFRPGAPGDDSVPPGNSIGWLVWHLTRVQDDHVAELAGTEQVWTRSDWVSRLGLPYEPVATGYAMSTADVDAFRGVEAASLLGYHGEVRAATQELLDTLEPGDLDRVVDEDYDPPVTLGARLVSVIVDDLQHAGQAGYLRGLLLG